MIGKILFTVAVVIAVMIFFRFHRARIAANAVAAHSTDDSTATGDSTTAAETKSLSPRILTYAMLFIFIAIMSAWFAHDYRDDNRIVSVRVISDGEIADYRARNKSIRGRSFTNTDGAHITLGAGDRIEIRR